MVTCPPTPLENYVQAAKLAGCPADQINRFVQAGVVLQPPQLAASAAARECDKPDGPIEVGMGGARGGGKSHWSFAQIAIDDCQRQPGLKVLFLRKVGASAQESVDDLRVRLLGQIKHRYVAGLISFPNGSRIILGHFQNEGDIDKYLGLEYDLIVIEESTTLTESKIRLIKTCLRTSKPNWRPRLYRTTNPGGVSHAEFKKRFIAPFRRVEQSETRFIPATFKDNKFLNKEYIGMLDQLVGWIRNAWLHGDWDVAAGMFYTNWREQVHVIKPFAIPPSWRKWCALDYGFTHPTVVQLFVQDDDGNIYIADEYSARKQLVEFHAQSIHAMLERHDLTVADLDTFVAGHDVFQKKGDKDGLTIADQYEQFGIHLERANVDRINGAAELLKRLGDVEREITPTLFIFDTCVLLIECIPAMIHNPKRPEDVLKVDCDEDGNNGDDPFDTARYGVMAGKTPTSSEVATVATSTTTYYNPAAPLGNYVPR